MKTCETQSQQMHLQNSSAPKSRGTLQKRGRKECKSQMIREFAVRVCLLVKPEFMKYNHMTS